MKNSAPHTSATSMVWPKSGWRTSSGDGRAQHERARWHSPGISWALGGSAEQPGDQDHEGGLEELDGWMLTPRSTIQRRAPLTSAPTIGREQHHHERDREHHEREPPDLARGEERRRQQHAERREQIQHVAMDEVETARGLQARRPPAGSRRATARCRRASARDSAASVGLSTVHHHSPNGEVGRETMAPRIPVAERVATTPDLSRFTKD